MPFLQGSVLSQRIFPTHRARELLAEPPLSTYVKDAGVSVHGFSHLGKSASCLHVLSR